MSVLDSLLEKKDLLIYIDTRIAELRDFNFMSVEEKFRFKTVQRIWGQIRELRRLRHTVCQGELKVIKHTTLLVEVLNLLLVFCVDGRVLKKGCSVGGVLLY